MKRKYPPSKLVALLANVLFLLSLLDNDVLDPISVLVLLTMSLSLLFK